MVIFKICVKTSQVILYLNCLDKFYDDGTVEKRIVIE